MKVKPKGKKKSISQLKKAADAVYSQYIRMSAVDPQTGLARCVSCGVEKNYKELQNGHYETRKTLSLRYDERNCHPQCVGCNVFKKGNYPRYATWMVETYGPDILRELEEEAKILVHDSRSLYEDIISEYKAKVQALQNNE